MSIRFYLSNFKSVREEEVEWIKQNVHEDEVFLSSVHSTVDFLNEEDSIMFTLRFGIKKSSTRLERMIAREKMLENMEDYNLRNSKRGMGPLCGK